MTPPLSVGRIVQYHETLGRYTQGPLAAIVTAVSDDSINLTVFCATGGTRFIEALPGQPGKPDSRGRSWMV